MAAQQIQNSHANGAQPANGTTSHGQGTAHILQESEEAGAFTGLAMGLTALGMAILPLLARVVL